MCRNSAWNREARRSGSTMSLSSWRPIRSTSPASCTATGARTSVATLPSPAMIPAPAGCRAVGALSGGARRAAGSGSRRWNLAAGAATEQRYRSWYEAVSTGAGSRCVDAASTGPEPATGPVPVTIFSFVGVVRGALRIFCVGGCSLSVTRTSWRHCDAVASRGRIPTVRPVSVAAGTPRADPPTRRGIPGNVFLTHPGSSSVTPGVRSPATLKDIAIRWSPWHAMWAPCGSAGWISIQSRPVWTGTPIARRFSAQASSRSHSLTRVL